MTYEKENMVENIMDVLLDNGIECYAPAVKEGICKSPYCVVKNEGASVVTGYSSQIEYYTVMCYVPQMQYTSIEPFKTSVKRIMEFLKPMIMPTGYETSSFYDDSYKAHMVSIQYRNYKQNNSL